MYNKMNKGMHEETVEKAKDLLREGKGAAEIMESTNLTLEEIKVLKNRIINKV